MRPHPQSKGSQAGPRRELAVVEFRPAVRASGPRRQRHHPGPSLRRTVPDPSDDRLHQAPVL